MIHDFSYLKQIIESHTIELKSIAKNINQFKLHFDELFKKADMPVEFHDLKSKFEDHLKKFKSFEESVVGRFSSLLTIISGFNQSILNHIKSHEPYEGRFSSLETEVQQLKDMFSKKQSLLQDEVLKQISTFTVSYNSHLENLKKEFIDHPKSISDSNKELTKRFEQTSLDCTNAIKRCRNTDALQQMLERKIKEFEQKIGR